MCIYVDGFLRPFKWRELFAVLCADSRAPTSAVQAKPPRWLPLKYSSLGQCITQLPTTDAEHGHLKIHTDTRVCGAWFRNGTVNHVSLCSCILRHKWAGAHPAGLMVTDLLSLCQSLLALAGYLLACVCPRLRAFPMAGWQRSRPIRFMPGVTGWTLLQHGGLVWERDGDPPAAALTLSIIPNSEEHFKAGKKASTNKEYEKFL